VVRAAGPVGDPRYVLAAVSVTDVDRSTSALRTALLIADPVLLVVLAIIAWVVIGQALRPVEELRAAAERVSGTGSPDPLPVPAARDEIRSLAVTLNDMLGRLTTARDRQRAFVDDAAHELRSPLASLQAQLEVAQRHGPTPELVDEALIDVQRLTRIVADLLLLARSDAGALPHPEQPVDVTAVVGAVLDRLPAVTARDLPDGPVEILGDADRLERIVVNLVDNAGRVADQLLAVSVHVDGDTVVLTVDDDGPGIAEVDRERVFQRFTRLDPARSGATGGSGLGLPIVREQVRGMSGTVELGDRPGGTGTRARCILPLWTEGRTDVDI
jgi:signal transduction histidine kinase